MKGSTLKGSTTAIRGIVPPIVTPFTETGGVDLDLLRLDLDALTEAGVHGVAVCGSTGEGHTLTPAEAQQVTRTAVEHVAGAMPVIAGVIADSTQAAIERGKLVADLGVAALQVTPVHYLFRPSDAGTIDFFGTLGEGAGLDVLIYNVIPWAYLSPNLLARVIRGVPQVVGVKQSAEDMKALADLLLILGDDGIVMSAVDALLYPSFALGAHGAIAAILSAAPSLCVQLWDAARAGENAEAKRLHEALLPLWNAISDDNLPANVKTAMRMQGRNGGCPRAPMQASTSAQQAAIRNALEGARLLP
ncbi:MAG: dihydrodipicolinate synthase family protein [Candidatus Poribacteria bacterium]